MVLALLLLETRVVSVPLHLPLTPLLLRDERRRLRAGGPGGRRLFSPGGRRSGPRGRRPRLPLARLPGAAVLRPVTRGPLAAVVPANRTRRVKHHGNRSVCLFHDTRKGHQNRRINTRCVANATKLGQPLIDCEYRSVMNRCRGESLPLETTLKHKMFSLQTPMLTPSNKQTHTHTHNTHSLGDQFLSLKGEKGQWSRDVTWGRAITSHVRSRDAKGAVTRHALLPCMAVRPSNAALQWISFVFHQYATLLHGDSWLGPVPGVGGGGPAPIPSPAGRQLILALLLLPPPVLLQQVALVRRPAGETTRGVNREHGPRDATTGMMGTHTHTHTHTHTQTDRQTDRHTHTHTHTREPG